MSLTSRSIRVGDAIEQAPEEEGVYQFLERRGSKSEVIYIGKAEGRGGIKARVQAHINKTKAGNKGVGRAMSRPGSKIGVRWETGSATNMEVMAMRRFVETHGKLPRCNSRQEMTRRGLGGLLDELASLFRE